jgi:Domain of unknown function (DUF151)
LREPRRIEILGQRNIAYFQSDVAYYRWLYTPLFCQAEWATLRRLCHPREQWGCIGGITPAGARIYEILHHRGTYFARLVLSAENESQQKKIIEIDARPSDCIAMAMAQRAPIYVSLDVWDELEDMTEDLRKMQQEGSHTEESDEEEES